MDHLLLNYTENVKETGEVEDDGLQKCSISSVGYSVMMARCANAHGTRDALCVTCASRFEISGKRRKVNVKRGVRLF